MVDYCAFSKDHTCAKWMDYELARLELEELDQLCHGNWIELQRLRAYVEVLQKLLDTAGIPYPDEFDTDI